MIGLRKTNPQKLLFLVSVYFYGIVHKCASFTSTSTAGDGSIQIINSRIQARIRHDTCSNNSNNKHINRYITKSSLSLSSQPTTTATKLYSSIGDLCGLSYEEPVFRPPAEWKSLILQVTVGCSWNKCTFCEMYQTKSFRARPITEIKQELDNVVSAGGAPYVRDVFLADGDAMTLPSKQLEYILDIIQDRLPHVRRISSYCLPRNIRGKSVNALSRLQSKGLSLVYVGCESGDDIVLSAIQKGETFDTSFDALHKLEQAGIKRSIMILLGLGGRELSTKHAQNSALLCSKVKPEYLSMLTTSFPRGKQRMEKGYQLQNVEFYDLTPREILQELQVFLTSIDLPRNAKTIFRADHASNYLPLKGRLGRDKEKLIGQLKQVLDAPPEEDQYNLRSESSRGL